MWRHIVQRTNTVVFYSWINYKLFDNPLVKIIQNFLQIKVPYKVLLVLYYYSNWHLKVPTSLTNTYCTYLHLIIFFFLKNSYMQVRHKQSSLAKFTGMARLHLTWWLNCLIHRGHNIEVTRTRSIVSPIHFFLVKMINRGMSITLIFPA